MEKPILIISSIVLVLTLFYYSEFDNKGTAYGILLICFIAIAFSYAKIKHPTESKDEYKAVEEENDKLENFDGIFEFKKDGFYIDKKSEFVKWDEIMEVNSFSIPLLKRGKQTGYQIITVNKNYEFNDQQTAGIVKLGNQLAENLTNWKPDSPTIRMNNHGLEKTIVYRKEN